MQLIKAAVKHLEVSFLAGWGNTAGRPDRPEFASDSVADLVRRCTVSGNLERVNENNWFVGLS